MSTYWTQKLNTVTIDQEEETAIFEMLKIAFNHPEKYAGYAWIEKAKTSENLKDLLSIMGVKFLPDEDHEDCHKIVIENCYQSHKFFDTLFEIMTDVITSGTIVLFNEEYQKVYIYNFDVINGKFTEFYAGR